MTYVSRILVLLLVGLFMMSASASADDRLTVSGLVDTLFNYTGNLSLSDRHYTKLSLGTPEAPAGQVRSQAGDEDSLSYGVTRFNLRFTIEAFENTRGVLQTHADREWGPSGVLFTNHDHNHGSGAAAYGGAVALEGYWFEGLIPGTAAKFEIGMPYIDAEFGGHGEATIFNTAAPGITLSAPLSDTITTYTWYAHLGQDFEGYGPIIGANVTLSGAFPAVTGTGNDWAAGTRVQFALMEGLSVDLAYVLHVNECGAGQATCNDVNRNWISGKVRYQYGDFSLLPSLTLYFADAAAGATGGDPESLLLDLRATYGIGPMTLQGRIVYTPGSDHDATGTVVTDRDYGYISVWGIPQSVQWFALFGNHSFTYLGPAYKKSIQTSIRHDTFGLVHIAAKAGYTLTPQTTLSASLGLFNAAEEPGSASVPSGIAMAENVTYAGGSSHIATEIDAWLDYQLYSNATISFWAAYAITGDALNLRMNNMVSESQDVVGAGARVLYTF